MLKEITIKILSKTWTVRLYSSAKYHKKFGYDSLALTYMYKRRIVVHPKGVTLKCIIHELVHGYLHEMCFSSTTKVSTDDLEEIFAEMMALRGREILDLAEKIVADLKNLS